MLHIGILKTWDSEAYKAGVQLAGSLTTYFDNLNVARNIPSSAMVVGNYVLVAIPGDNPRDACVVASWPQGSAGSFLDLSDTPSSYAGQAAKLAKVKADESGLEFDELDMATPLADVDFVNIDWQTIDRWTQTNTGSASQAVDILGCDLVTGATSGSTARIRNTNDYLIVMRNAGVVHRYFIRNFGIVQSASTIWLGVFRNVTAPSDTALHIGWKIINGKVYASNGNGSAQTITDTGDTTLTEQTWLANLNLTILWPNSSTAQFYIGTTLVATHTTNFPGGLQQGRAIYEMTNTAALNQRIRVIRAFYAGPCF